MFRRQGEPPPSDCLVAYGHGQQKSDGVLALPLNIGRPSTKRPSVAAAHKLMYAVMSVGGLCQAAEAESRLVDFKSAPIRLPEKSRLTNLMNVVLKIGDRW